MLTGEAFPRVGVFLAGAGVTGAERRDDVLLK